MADIDPHVANTPAVTVPTRWTGRFWAFVTAVGIGSLLFAIVAGVAGAVIVTEQFNGGGLAAAVLVQAVTLPVLLARIEPVWAACALAVGAVLNEVVIGPMVRCAVIFPVMLVIVYQLGAADPVKYRNVRWLGIGACVATTAMELAWDPALDGSSGIFVASLGVGFYCAGLLIRSRTTLVATLRRRTNELHEQRDRTAALEVAADRARVGADLERLIRAQIRAIGVRAEQAQAAGDADTVGAQAALIDVENSGRETLARMRDIVGNLRDAPTDPPPGLDQLSALLRRATCSDARLTIQGPARPLSTNVELSAYRIVEQLLTTLRDHPKVRVDVNVRFTDEALEIRVSGPTLQSDSHRADSSRADSSRADSSRADSSRADSSRADSSRADSSRADSSRADSSRADSQRGGVDLQSALHAVRVRAEMHGGTVMTSTPVGRLEAEVRLPLLTAAAG